MPGLRLSLLMILTLVLVATGTACIQPTASPQEESRRIAEEYVKQEATFLFDGIPQTLKVKSTTPAGDGWRYTIEFDSRHGGYGNRTGQALDLVITHHVAEITVEKRLVTSAIMDGRWDMINQRFDVEIKLAPIDEVRVYMMKSNPPQIGVYIKGGLPDGCTAFHDIKTTREGSTVKINVTVQRPRGVACPAIYTSFEKDVNLGSNFAFGTTYTLNVNDYSTTFEGTLMKGEGFAVYLTRDNIPPDKMEMLSHVDIAGQPIIASQDIITYNAQTHEIKLTGQAFERISKLEVPVRGKSFLVCVDRAPIYWGAFWTPFSSVSFDGVNILQPSGTPVTQVITIGLGYPSLSFYRGTDPRNDQTVIKSLEQAGKLVNQPLMTPSEKLPRSFKGYELYSWEENGQWHFTLITGTNRTKTMEEITSKENIISDAGWVKIHVTGVEAVKGVFRRLPENESVIWYDELHIGQTTGTNLQLPSARITDNIKEFAAQCKLELFVSIR